MDNAIAILTTIFLEFKRLLSSVSLGGFTWWDLFCALWIVGIVLGVIGLLFKQKEG